MTTKSTIFNRADCVAAYIKRTERIGNSQKKQLLSAILASIISIVCPLGMNSFSIIGQSFMMLWGVSFVVLAINIFNIWWFEYKRENL